MGIEPVELGIVYGIDLFQLMPTDNCATMWSTYNFLLQLIIIYTIFKTESSI